MLTDALWRQVQRQASVQGISASQYMREAALARLYYELGRTGNARVDQALTAAQKRPRR